MLQAPALSQENLPSLVTNAGCTQHACCKTPTATQVDVVKNNLSASTTELQVQVLRRLRIHTGTGTHRDWYTQGLVHTGTGTCRDWYTQGLVHTGTDIANYIIPCGGARTDVVTYTRCTRTHVVHVHTLYTYRRCTRTHVVHVQTLYTYTRCTRSHTYTA